jgi:hypothetical protein
MPKKIMKIKLLQNVAHATSILVANTVHEIEDAVSRSLIKRGLAAPHTEPAGSAPGSGDQAADAAPPAPPKGPAKSGK